LRVAFVSLGCAKNLVNTEQMMALTQEAGHSVTGEADGADAAVVNTCGFIDAAKSEAIEPILELAQLKKAGRLGKILVACWVPAAIPGWRRRWKLSPRAARQYGSGISTRPRRTGRAFWPPRPTWPI
jgi:hypothetical protein